MLRSVALLAALLLDGCTRAEPAVVGEDEAPASLAALLAPSAEGAAFLWVTLAVVLYVVWPRASRRIMAFTIAVKWASSHTKMYTGAATMILEERELLSLDDPISKFLPDTMLEGLHRHKGSDYSDCLERLSVQSRWYPAVHGWHAEST